MADFELAKSARLHDNNRVTPNDDIVADDALIKQMEYSIIFNMINLSVWIEKQHCLHPSLI